MPIYDLKCDVCKEIHPTKISLDIVNINKDFDKLPCPKCGKVMYQTFETHSANFFFKEGEGNESSKPGSYWRNAEENRINSMKKKEAAKREKQFYRDKETMIKNKNRKKNIKRFEDEI